MKYCNLFIFAMLTIFGGVVSKYEHIKLIDNGYEGIVIAINPEVPENPQLISDLQNIWTEASKVLWTASKNRTYFKNITILVPGTWKNGTYEASGNYTYDNADILVAKEHPGFGNEPYTLQVGECGGHGEYIHLTPEYVTEDRHVANYGPKGKIMIHEWAHLRWGVFDETPTANYPEFYYKDSKLEATRCPSSTVGLNARIEYINETLSLGDCEIDPQTGLPPTGECRFLPFLTQHPNITTSFMSHTFLDQVVHFCHDDHTDPMNQHNKEAPNEHNRLCGQRSTWDVITSTEDFISTTVSKRANITPTFNVVQASPDNRFVLVLDTSGSMFGRKMEEAITASALFINEYAPQGSRIGIVDFDHVAITLSNLTSVNTQADRTNLTLLLPERNDAGGGTIIYLGVEQAITILKENSTSCKNVQGAKILVLTDGAGSWDRTTENKVKACGIQLSTIFFGLNSGNQFLQDLSDSTGGVWDYASELNDLLGTFAQFGQVTNGDDRQRTFQIQSDTYTVTSSGLYATVPIDSTVGKNTIFTFAYSGYYAPYIDLYDPNGVKYCSDNHSPGGCHTITTGVVNGNYSTITFRIPMVADAGTWFFYMQPSSPATTIVTSSITSMASDPNVEPIRLQAGMSKTEIGDLSPLVVYARVTQGFAPVLGAKVIATISLPDGTSTELQLFDKGAAPDIRRNDGVYSRYFTGYRTNGRYSLRVKVSNGNNSAPNFPTTTPPAWVGTTGDPYGYNTSPYYTSATGSPATVIYGFVSANGTITLNENFLVDSFNGVIPPANNVGFERVESPGGFGYYGPVLSASTDLFPPNKIINLQVEQVNVDNVTEGFRLSFSAPGDDYDLGTAQSYDIRYAFNQTSTLVSNFTESSIVEHILYPSLLSPQIAGSDEEIIVRIDDIPYSEQVTKIGFVIRAIDDAKNTAQVSNIALVNVFLVPPKDIPVEPSCLKEDGNADDESVYFQPSTCNYFKCNKGRIQELVCPNQMGYNVKLGYCQWLTQLSTCIIDVSNTSYIQQENIECIPDAPKEECPTDLIAGPEPEGYTNEEECTSANACWDSKQKKCFCLGEDKCPEVILPEPECRSTFWLHYLADPNDCTKYYRCFAGFKVMQQCLTGFVFDPDYSICSHKAFVSPPCGTRFF